MTKYDMTMVRGAAEEMNRRFISSGRDFAPFAKMPAGIFGRKSRKERIFASAGKLACAKIHPRGVHAAAAE